MRRILLALAGALAVCLGPAAAEPVRFVVFGDMPYEWPRDLTRFADLIAAADALEPDFLVHVGDIKSGGSPCTEEAYQTVLDLFRSSASPLIYTPGDNEWTDCRGESAGRYDPSERLSLLRRLFFPPGQSLGRTPLPVEAQSEEPAFAAYVENCRWRVGNVLFATLHVVGSNNNLGFDQAGDAEHRERMRAVLAWLRAAFAEARRVGADAVVLFFQADPLFEIPFPFRTGFNGFIALLEEQATAFGKPILIVHGDTHELVLDRPVRTPSNEILRNLVRLVVPGANTIEGVRVTVDPEADLPFEFIRVPGGERLTAPWGGS